MTSKRMKAERNISDKFKPIIERLQLAYAQTQKILQKPSTNELVQTLK